MYCLDSDFLIDVLRGSPPATALLHRISRQARPSVSAITAFEVTDTVRPPRRETAIAALETVEILPVDGSVALAASQLSAALRMAGRATPPSDLLIAATCVLRNLTLVTRNARHFGRIPRLRVRGW